MGPRYYHLWSADQDPAELLLRENQCSTPWDAPDHGPCDKCDGTGATTYRCRSCIAGSARDDCPACGGRIEFEDICPACEGDGEITRTRRNGVSVFPSIEGLYCYMAERDADGAGCVLLELAGRRTADLDLDADAGALLIRPTRVLALHPFDVEHLEELKVRLRGRLPYNGRSLRP